MPDLTRLLERLSGSLDGDDRAAIDARFRRALSFEPLDRPPLVVSYPYPPGEPLQPVPHREIFADPRAMLYNELLHAFDTSILLRGQMGDDLPLTVRPNFGTVLIASMFGAQVEQTGDNPPWIRHDGAMAIPLEAIAESDPSDLMRGWVPRVIETYEVYHELLDGYPELKPHVRIVLPDLQGPLDNLALIRGSGVFLELATEPAAVDRAMATLAATQVALARRLGRWTTEPHPGFCHQHAVMLRGNILLRNDSSIMLSAAMYREQVGPHDEHVLRELGGGGLHACGAVGHLVDAWLELPSLCSLDLGQSELNDAEAIHQKATAREVPLIRVAVEAEQLRTGEAMQRFPTGAVLIHRARDLASARAAVQSYRGD
jgi:hypothetical protein